jgi:hypothetical protein
MPKRKISSGPTQLQQDCSDGAKMLIEQMKLHPEEFKGYAGKFTNLLDTAREASQGLHRNVKMSTRDAKAILDAAEEHLYEVWLAEDVLTMMMRPKEEPEKDLVYATAVKGGLWQGAVPSTLYTGNITSNTTANIGSSHTTTSPYNEQEYQRELARYKMEMQKIEMERQRKQENEYAMRNTKPFTGFI